MTRPPDWPNINYAWCGLLVEELVRQGVAGFVISPGSRSAPLTVSVARNERARYWMHYDERGAAFFALGLAKAAGKPTVLICTSGSAAANYWPAVVEAAMDHTPLIVLTADRPPELVDCGANQAIDQTHLFGRYARWYSALPCPTADCSPNYVLTTADQAWHRSQHPLAGPVHINVPLREPLDPVHAESVSGGSVSDGFIESLKDWWTGDAPFTRYIVPEHQLRGDEADALLKKIQAANNGLLLVGRLASPAETGAARALCLALGWPVHADIASGLHGPAAPTNLVDIGSYLSDRMSDWTWSLDCVVHVGGGYTSKPLLGYLSTKIPCYVHVCNTDQRLDPNHAVSHHLSMPVVGFCEWLTKALGTVAESGSAPGGPWPVPHTLSEKAVAAMLGDLLPADSLLFAGNSMPIRLVEGCCRPKQSGVRIAANRGASGIDGNIATALGMAAGGAGATTILVGDLTALHDLNSLVLHQHARGPVVLVVLNNDGGGIFHYLPIAESDEPCFEACFGTPHGLDFAGAARMFGLNHTCPETPADFAAAYNDALKADRATVIEVRTDRYASRHPHHGESSDLPVFSLCRPGADVPSAMGPMPLAGDPDSPPLLLLHGFMGDRTDWADLARELGSTHYVLGVNLPGHGPGWDDVFVEDYTMEHCASELNEHLNRLGIGTSALLGYSLGGRFALCLATRFPDRFTRVVLESVSPGLGSEEKRQVRQVQDLALAERLAEMTPGSEAFREFLEEWYAQPLFDSLQSRPELRDDLIRRRHARNDPRLLAQSLNALGTGSQPNLWPALERFHTPTLLLVGELDRKFRIIAEDMSAACPAMAVEVMTGCGHNVHLENPKKFLTIVRAFLNPPSAGGDSDPVSP